MDEYKIESGIPMPKSERKSSPWRDLALKMEIGDCVDVGTNAHAKALCMALKMQQKKGSLRGTRVWRLE